ncbi:uncharacterized protein LOC114357780 [Ostrinia furnacalis]|uniref:uncharacterized protein LOC114357780 n=1 Tax=Ostrinia furnacalis TaxID=93504 RepID=UPI00103B9FD1|nr:uncharacterized protein LOC114357780 [Ostrinia furnacalis]
MRWSEVETLKFVKMYLRHENLWNPSDTSYKMKIKREKAYNDIITEFHSSTGILMSETELRIKIKNLRSTYTQEVSKIRQRSSPDFIYTPTIKWFAEWHSCFSAIKKRMDSLEDEANEKKNCNLTDQKHNPLTSQSNDYLLFLKAEPQDFSLSMSQKIKKKRKSKKNSPNFPERSQRDNVDLCSSSKDDEFDIYGKYLAAQLRNMDFNKALRLQLEIQTIVSEARMTALSGT